MVARLHNPENDAQLLVEKRLSDAGRAIKG